MAPISNSTRRSFSSLTVFFVNDNSKISSGFTFFTSIRYLILPIIVKVLPEPAPAITKLEYSSVKIALLC